MDQINAIAPSREPWNKGKLIGQKTPLKLKEIWAIRIRLQIANRIRDLALFNLAIDSKLRACDLVKLRVRDLCHGERVTALDETLNYALFDRALKPARLAKLPAVALHTLPEGARAGVVGAIHPSCLERTAALRARPSPRRLALRSHTGRNAPNEETPVPRPAPARR